MKLPGPGKPTDKAIADPFSELADQAPSRTLAGFYANRSDDPSSFAQMSLLHMTIGDAVEAFSLSDQALARRAELSPVDTVRALMVHGYCGQLLFISRQYRRDFFEAFAMIDKFNLAGTDIHVALLTNWAGAQFTMGELQNGLDTLRYADALAADLPSSNTLRNKRLLTIAYNIIIFESDPGSLNGALLSLIASAESLGVIDIAAMAHMSLANELFLNNLYTAGLYHASRSWVLYQQFDRPAQARAARLQIARFWFNLAIRDQGRQALMESENNIIPGLSWRSNEVSTLLLHAEDVATMSDIESALRDHHEALNIIMPDIDRAPGLLLITPLNEILTSALMISGRNDFRDEFSYWLSVIDRFATYLDSLETDFPYGDFFRVIRALVTEDEEGLAQVAERLQKAFESARPPGDFIEAAKRVLAIQPEVSRWLGKDMTLEADLIEYWQHISHVTGEDDERIRAAYRRANVLPVLHRILVKKQISPWGQFEAVELSRWGSLSGAIASLPSPVDTRAAMRAAFLKDSERRDVRYPASLGHARTVCWRSRPSAFSSSVGPQPLIDLYTLIARNEWIDEPEILQMYLLGDRVHSVHIDFAQDKISRNEVRLSRRALDVFRAANIWMSPQPRQIDQDIVASLDLPLGALTTVAAIRCCIGPFVQNRRLARDFALQLPPTILKQLSRDIEGMNVPSLDDLSRSLGEIIPPALLRPSNRPLLLSLSNDLIHLPLCLAANDNAYLGMARCLTLLPPINTLAALSSPNLNSTVDDWTLLAVGNTRHDLGYITGVADSGLSIRDALMLRDRSNAHRTATIYKGHYDVPSIITPSVAGVPDSETSLLTAADVLASNCVAPARIALMSCRAAGVQFPDEWGGIASALMVKGAREVIAPNWLLIDSEETNRLDCMIQKALGNSGHLEVAFRDILRVLMNEWLDREPHAIGPHWWGGLSILKG